MRKGSMNQRWLKFHVEERKAASKSAEFIAVEHASVLISAAKCAGYVQRLNVRAVDLA
jgi:hypothetical protein